MSPPPSPERHHPLLDPEAPVPLLSMKQRRLVVREVLKTARLGLFANPKALAYRMGITRTYYFPEHGEAHPGADIVAYAWHPDFRERNWRAHQELVRVLLRRGHSAHNESDIRLTAFDLAVPEEAALTSLSRLARDQQHCPEAILRRVFEARKAHSPKG